MSGLPAERIKFGFLKDYAIRGIDRLPRKSEMVDNKADSLQ